MKKHQKTIFILSIILIILSIGFVPKAFQNDTFFNISIGKYILNNGIDMKEHFSWIQGLDYTYSHWAFDILMYFLYFIGNFKAIYFFTILFTIIISLTMFILLTKTNKSPIVSFIITLLSIYLLKDNFVARSQIISFLCFFIEIYCIESLIKYNKNKYAIFIIILSIIIANFHAATWPLTLILFMPYLTSSFIKALSFNNLYTKRIKILENKLKISKKPDQIKEKLDYYKNFINNSKNTKPVFEKIIIQKNYNEKKLIIVMILVAFTGLLTPTKFTPYTYIINSMFGNSNFENHKSIDFISEMQPGIPASNLAFFAFPLLFLLLIAFLPNKIKLEHCFLLMGLYIMSVESIRYVCLLVLLGSYVLCDILVQSSNTLIFDDLTNLEKLLNNKKIIFPMIFLSILSTTSNLTSNLNVNYVDQKLYPVLATNYIKENLDYQKIRIYNSYNFGSYLMLYNIPVFIDSRLDVYCSEFNNTDIFKDYIYARNGYEHYENIFSKYNFTHILLYNDETLNIYISKDNNYSLIYSDDNFSLYQRNLN